VDPLRQLTRLHGFFSRAQAREVGYDDRAVTRAVRAGYWVRFRRGFYAFADEWRGADDAERHRTRSRAVLHSLGDAVALSHVSAVLAHGIAVWDVDLSRVHVTRLDGGPGRIEGDVIHHEGLCLDQELMDVDGQLLGRRTYEGFAAAWPDRDDEAGFAEKMNGMPKYVVSNTLENPTWNNTTVLKGDGVEAVRKLKEDGDGDLLVAGSAQLSQSLLAAGLVDELRLMIFPLIIGAGKKLFPETDAAAPMKLVESKPVGPDGVVIAIYQPKGE